MERKVFETERLWARLLTEGDLEGILEIWGDAEVMSLSGGGGTREQTARSLQFYMTMQEERGFSPYLLILTETGETVGICGFNPPVENYDAELLYHFKKKHWGQGYATESVKGILKYAGEVLKLNSITASADPMNTASLKVLEKSGFSYLGLKWYEDNKQMEPCYEWRRTE